MGVQPGYDADDVPVQHPRHVLDALAAAQAYLLVGEGDRCPAQSVDPHLEGNAGSHRRLLKDQRKRSAGQWRAGPAPSLHVVCEVEEGGQLLIAQLGDVKKISSAEPIEPTGYHRGHQSYIRKATSADHVSDLGGRLPLSESVDPAILASPVGLAKLSFQDLPARIARDGVNEVDRPRTLEAGQPVTGPLDQCLTGELSPRFSDDYGLDCLAPAIVRYADHCYVADGGMVRKHTFELGRIDVLAARHDHVRDTVPDVDEPVGVDAACVACVEPAAVDRGRRVLRTTPVALHDANAAVHDLADLARGEFHVQRVDHFDVAAEHRAATREQPLAVVVLEPQCRDCARGLRQPVDLREPALEDLDGTPEQLLGDG